MDESNNVLICLEELLESSFLPKLKDDLDSVPIEDEHFAEYRNGLRNQLPVIYDLVQQQKRVIFENPKLQSLLILLCCELSAPNTVYRLNDDLLKNATKILQENQRELNSNVEELIFKYYQTKLRKDEWKRQLGSVHGFEQYLQIFYNNPKNIERTLNANWLNFSLSVGLTVRDCHESAYKHLGIRVFLILLKHAHPEDMRNLNIHSVIYDSVFKDVHIMESVAATEDIWNCLYLCLDFLENIDSFNWSQVDDMLEVLIRNVPLTSNNSVSICMLNFVPKVCAYFTLSREEIILKCNSNFKEVEMNYLKECCECCSSNTSYSCFRWSKSILELIIFESYKLIQDSDTCLQLLEAMQRCYLVCILPIPLQVNEYHLIEFFEKFTSVLMEVIVTHKKSKDVIQLSKVFINIFRWQLEHSSYVEQSPKLSKLRDAFEQLIKHKIFS